MQTYRRLIISLVILLTLVISHRVYGQNRIHFEGLLQGQKVILPIGLYDIGQTDVSGELQNFVDQLSLFLKKNKGLKIEIAGHTDNVGSPEFNMKLSQERARSVKDYLVSQKGIESNRITARGYSQDYPLVDNKTREGRTTNRRIEIIGLGTKQPPGRLSYIMREVLSKSVYDAGFFEASLDQGLFNRDQVITRKKSHATITFLDLSKVSLDPQSLLIMYARPTDQQTAETTKDVQLLTGGLRTKLNKMKGDFRIETPSCSINSDSIEIQVGIDENKMSLLSVYDGTSSVEARDVIIEVPKGYGTYVKMNEPPAAPQPLPLPPAILGPNHEDVGVLPSQLTTEVDFSWEGPFTDYRLQVSKEQDFVNCLHDERIARKSVTIRLEEGFYHWRVAAINEIGLEGFAARSTVTMVAYETLEELPWSMDPPDGSVFKTMSRSFTISGETLPGTAIQVGYRKFTANKQGFFDADLFLHTGRNDLSLIAIRAGYKQKTAAMTACYYDFWESAPYVQLRTLQMTGTDAYQSWAGIMAGYLFAHDAHWELEVMSGVTKLDWKEDPGEFERRVIAIPINAELHFVPKKSIRQVYVSAGLTGYLALLKDRVTNDYSGDIFLSPECGIGFAFPSYTWYPFRVELKYLFFPEKEPFSDKISHGFVVAIKAKL